MSIQEEILLNKYGQDLIDLELLTELFNIKNSNQKKQYLNKILFIIMQSKPNDEDIYPAILNSKLKPTYTPCILLLKGVATHNLQKLVALPENEVNKVFLLMLSLYKIAYKRRFDAERNNPTKWWYHDLSNEDLVNSLLNMNR